MHFESFIADISNQAKEKEKSRHTGTFNCENPKSNNQTYRYDI